MARYSKNRRRGRGRSVGGFRRRASGSFRGRTRRASSPRRGRGQSGARTVRIVIENTQSNPLLKAPVGKMVDNKLPLRARM